MRFVRALLGIHLIAVLATCPLWCATEAGRPALHTAHDEPGFSQDNTAPCPVNDDDCVCHGAVADGIACERAEDASRPVDGMFLTWLPPFLFAGDPLHIAISPARVLAGLPPPRAPSIESLQTFRC